MRAVVSGVRMILTLPLVELAAGPQVKTERRLLPSHATSRGRWRR